MFIKILDFMDLHATFKFTATLHRVYTLNYYKD